MPEMNGIELFKKIREEGNTIPFIIFTCRNGKTILEKVKKQGPNGYIQKQGEPKKQFQNLSKIIKEEVDRAKKGKKKT